MVHTLDDTLSLQGMRRVLVQALINENSDQDALPCVFFFVEQFYEV